VCVHVCVYTRKRLISVPFEYVKSACACRVCVVSCVCMRERVGERESEKKTDVVLFGYVKTAYDFCALRL